MGPRAAMISIALLAGLFTKKPKVSPRRSRIGPGHKNHLPWLGRVSVCAEREQKHALFDEIFLFHGFPLSSYSLTPMPDDSLLAILFASPAGLLELVAGKKGLFLVVFQ